ncbi:hypothetical protein J1614_011983 [Plenodomus biglobosus]|nr:hypothetical protein J1614_011983 [Plenodomus biglobosus]
MEDTSSLEEPGKSCEFRSNGDDSDISKAGRSVVPGLDGQASGVLKRIHKALAVECDPWVDFLDLKGASNAWYEDDGSVNAWYGTPE